MSNPPKTIIIFLFVFLSFVFVARYLLIGQAVYGDGISYYSYVHSVMKDHDLNFINEFEHRYDHSHNNSLKESDKDVLKPNTKTRMLANKYPIGAPLLWLTPYFVVDTTSNIISVFNHNFPNNGYSDVYQISLGIFNVVLVGIGLYFIYKMLILYFDSNISILAVTAVTLGSNLFYYSAIDAINSHPSSFFASSLFFYVLLNKKTKQNLKYLLLGAFCGLIALIRTQDLIFLSIPLITLATSDMKINQKIKNSTVLILSFALVFSLQLISWKIIYGTYFALPYISSKEGFNFLHPHILELLINTKNGLLLWSPFYLLSFVGLLIFKKAKKYEGNLFILFFLAQVYLISSWSGWSQGEAFGTRMLISCLPFLAIGFAQIIKLLNNKLKSFALILLLVVFNFSAIFYFLLIIQNPTYDLKNNTQNQAILKIERLFRR